jgi:hypothetical protein
MDGKLSNHLYGAQEKLLIILLSKDLLMTVGGYLLLMQLQNIHIYSKVYSWKTNYKITVPSPLDSL